MKPLLPTALGLFLTTLSSLAGPYAPAAGQAGSTAIHRPDPRILTWASRVTSYQAGTDCLPQWQDTSKALGPATEDSAHITCLGAGGTITLAFPSFIKNGPGADFAVFENSFLDGYIEHAWVEVSRDGVNFVRFPNHSLTASPVGSFGLMDPTEVQGLGCKYRQPYGEPYDLAEVGLDSVSHVRLVDVIGDGTARDSANRVIHDPFPNAQSAGFDLDAVGVLNAETWQTLAAGNFLPDAVNSTAFAHLPDGRFLLGAQGQLSVQTAWGLPGRTTIGSAGVEFDPSFIAVRNANSALLGTGGGFGATTGVHTLNSGAPTPVLAALPLAQLQNYSAVYWKPALANREGWLVVGTNGQNGKSNLTFISPDGSLSGPVTGELSTYSGGLTVDAAGNVYVGLYELSGSEANQVIRFRPAHLLQAVSGLSIGDPSPVPRSLGVNIFRFDSASSLACDAMGRLWGTGPSTRQIQGYDPATGASVRIAPDHAMPAGVTDPIYQVQSFTRDGIGYLSFLAQDEAGTPGTPILHGLAPLTHLPVPETISSWRAFRFFGSANLTPANEATLWGNGADPDGDGIPNLLEYALTTPPLVADSAPVQAGQSNGRLTLTFSRNPLRPDLRYTVEVSPSLAPASWSPIAVSEAGAPTAAAAPALPSVTETASGKVFSVNVRDPLAMTSQARRFLRLRVTLLP